MGGNQRSEGKGGPESEGEVRGGSGRSRGTRGGVQALDGEQELARRVPARRGHALILLAKEEDDRGGGQVGRVGHLGRQVRSRWASLSLSLYFSSVLFFLFNHFATDSNSKEFQNSDKTL